jgi:hypothetical protein
VKRWRFGAYETGASVLSRRAALLAAADCVVSQEVRVVLELLLEL